MNELLEKAKAVALRPGDALVLHFDRHLSPSEAEQIRARAGAALPGNKVVIVDATVDSVRVRQAGYERPEHRACRRQS